MAKTATGEGSAHDATVVAESNVQRLERELFEARKAGEREALEKNIENANSKALRMEEHANAAYEAKEAAQKELEEYDAAQAEAAAAEKEEVE